MRPTSLHPSQRQRICVLGATGTIGRAVVAELVRRGVEVVCFVRPDRRDGHAVEGATVRSVDVNALESILHDGIAGERFDAIISCLASRTGVPGDAWAIDHAAHVQALNAAKQAGIGHFILLSAICVQKPRLAFQHAKLVFEAELIASGMRYSIVRPTAFFKSLSGQIDRVRNDKPFLLFGDGKLTACKPISDGDLAAFIAECITDQSRWNQILPIGGPGPAITPREQGEALFRLLGKPPRFRSVPVGLLSGIAAILGSGRFIPAVAAKAELARIGQYYATESMLVLDPVTGQYDADATPETGSDTLVDHYRAMLDGQASVERGDHAIF
jgi:divinyl chlorophyllide a 8-vinyl-reductase